MCTHNKKVRPPVTEDEPYVRVTTSIYDFLTKTTLSGSPSILP